MTTELGGSTRQNACPLRCWRRRGAGDTATADAADQVDWAGLPVKLDFVFSQQQLDKVYGQYLKRRHGAQLWRWSPNGGPPCACELTEDTGRRDSDASDSISRR